MKSFPKAAKAIKKAFVTLEPWMKQSKIKKIKAPLHQHRLLQLEQKFVRLLISSSFFCPPCNFSMAYVLSLPQAQNAIKVGVIYAKAGQKKESEMLSNTKGSTEFNDFLGFMGDFVRLKGWKKYAGGLDTESTNRSL